MKVLFVPRDDAAQIFGGDVVQMRKTAEALRALGVSVDLCSLDACDPDAYDVVHLWQGLHFPGPLLRQLDALKTRTTRHIALSTIWAPHHLVRWMDAARKWFFTRHPDAGMQDLQSMRTELDQIARRELDFTVDGARLAAFAPHPFTTACRAVLDRVDLILPNSWMELSAIFTFLGDRATSSRVVPNAVDATDFDGADGQRVPDALRNRPYALMSARFDTRKQQDFAMLALKDTDLPLVFVGAPTDGDIVARTRALGSQRRTDAYILPFVEHEQLKHLYAGARVHFLPSLFESPGLASLEAALCDASIVVGNLAFEAEYFEDGAHYCDPCDVFSIRSAVIKAWERHDTNASSRDALRARIRDRFTWRRAAEETLAGYHQAMQTTPANASATPNC